MTTVIVDSEDSLPSEDHHMMKDPPLQSVSAAASASSRFLQLPREIQDTIILEACVKRRERWRVQVEDGAFKQATTCKALFQSFRVNFFYFFLKRYMLKLRFQRALYSNVMLSNAWQRHLFVERLAESGAHREATASLVRSLTVADFSGECKEDASDSSSTARRRAVSAEEYIDDLCKVLEACRTVTRLSFDGLAMSTLVGQHVVACISSLDRLAELHVAPTSPAGNGFRRLLDAAPGLRFLGLERVFLSRAPPSPLFFPLAKSHGCLESVMLNDQRFTSDYARLLAGVSLRTLRLRNMDEVASVVEAVAPTLENLEIVGMEDDSLTASAVRCCVQLKTLEIQLRGRGRGQDEDGDGNLRAALEYLPPSVELLSVRCDDARRTGEKWLENWLKNADWCPKLKWLRVGRIDGEFLIAAASVEELLPRLSVLVPGKARAAVQD
jgi:hypothetical protein